MKERASLKRQITLVNQRAPLCAFFLLAACGNVDKQDNDTAPIAIEGKIIWQTPKFEAPIVGFSVVDTAPVEVMLANEDAGVQMIDADGAAISKLAPYTLSALGTGVTATFDDTTLTVFPGLTKNSGNLSLLVNGTGLEAPIELPVEGAPIATLKGICAGAPNGDGVIQIGYWTELAPDTLVLGDITSTDNNFTFTETSTITEDKYITSCGIDRDLIAIGGGFGLKIYSDDSEPTLIELPGVPVSTSATQIGTGGVIATALSRDDVYLSKPDGTFGKISFVESLSARAPSTVGQVSIHTKGSIGSLSNGFLAAESISGASSQIIYLDLKALNDQLTLD